MDHGSFDIVYNAMFCGTDVAVKEIKIDQQQKEMAVDEMRIWNEVHHPNTTLFIGYTLQKEQRIIYLLIVTELIQGHTLSEIITDVVRVDYDFSEKKEIQHTT